MNKIERHPLRNPILQLVIGIYAVIWVILAVKPLWRPEWLLENYLVFFCWGFIALSMYKFRLSPISYILIFTYLTFHAFGAHYGYCEVPFGYWLSNYFHFARPNVYDRVVHFLFGFLFTYPLYEVLRRYSSFSNVWLLILPSEFILSYSAFYELIEAGIAWSFPAGEYDAYVGLQGDIWDGYRDMLCAFSGSLAITFINAAKYLYNFTYKKKKQ